MDLSSIHILFIEDDLIDRMAFERFVESNKLDLQYTLSESLKEATNILYSDHFDLVITDYNLGDGNAMELMEAFPGIPFIVVTGMGDQELAVKAMKKGAYDYIIKDNKGNYLETLPVVLQNAIRRKQQEEEIETYKKNLELLVIERTRQLEKEIQEKTKREKELEKQNKEIKNLNKKMKKALTKAEEADRLKSAFLANMSHEVRTPLNAIMGFSDFLQNEKLDQKSREMYIDIIQNSGNQLLAIIGDIIDISKIEADLIDLHVQDCNINAIMEEIKVQSEQLPEVKKKNLLFKTSKTLEDADAIIRTDEVRLRQIFTNLIDNAVKFTSSGTIVSGYYIEDNTIVFYVKDSGIGISKDQQEVIFERFRQIEESNTRKYGGTGLGLAIAKGLVDIMKGKMWLESNEREGSTFYFALPYCPGKGKSKSNATSKTNTELDLKDKKILIVEDDELNYLYLKEALTKTHARILRARDGEEAIQIFKDNPDLTLVLLDIRLPKLNGFEAIVEMQKINKDIPVIAQTAYASDEDKTKCLELGCIAYLAKPIRNHDLKNAIHKSI